MSKRLIVTIPDSIAKALAAEAKAREISMSFLLRDAYQEHCIRRTVEQANANASYMPRKSKGNR